jgi:hypothetical protein
MYEGNCKHTFLMGVKLYMIKDYILDKDDKSVRGSFINGMITISILACTVYGLLFSDLVTVRLEKLATFIIGFFTSSYGLWSLKKHMDSRLNSAENIANIEQGNVLPKTPSPVPGQPPQPVVYQQPPDASCVTQPVGYDPGPGVVSEDGVKPPGVLKIDG